MKQLKPGEGWVEVVVGCMFSGKTEELLRRLRRAQYAKQTVIAVKPVIDDRYHVEKLATHTGQTLEAIPIRDVADLMEKIGDACVVGIDEAQFIKGIADAVQDLANEGRRVIVAGLDMDYQGIPFGPIPELLATAEKVSKLSAVCMVCGASATRSQRIVDSEEQVVIGATGVYEARCRKHWNPKPIFSQWSEAEG